MSDSEKRLAVATELLRQAEGVLQHGRPMMAEEVMEDKERKTRVQVTNFLDEEFKSMGVPDRHKVYE